MKHGQILKNGKEIAQVIHDEGTRPHAAIFDINSLRLTRTTDDAQELLKQDFHPTDALITLKPLQEPQ